MKKEKQIKKELDEHLNQTVVQIKNTNSWNSMNIPELSETELMQIADTNGLRDDEQTRSFCKFISLGTNFASLNFAARFQVLPELVLSICDLIEKMEKEIKEFAEIAGYFSNLIKSFVKLVMNTKHNMNMVLPNLEESVTHLSIMSDALMPESDCDLKQEDINDINKALTSMSTGIVKLINHAKQSKEESVQLDKRINNLKYDIETKVTVTENRIGFGKLLPKLGASIGMVSGATAIGGAVESAAFGGAGALVLGGLSFPPLGAILLGAAIGAISIGSVLFLIIKLWEKHQFKAVGYLNAILEKLNELNAANLHFMDSMNRSEENANKILANLDYLKNSVGSNSLRYRKTNSDICKKAIESTNDMIKSIHKVNEININQWIHNRGQHLERSEEFITGTNSSWYI